MLQFQDIELRRGRRLLIEHATLTIHGGQKVGITGANGSGKSSLFALILGQLDADAGTLDLPSDQVVAHVAQETPALDTPARDYVMGGDTELEEIRRDLASAEANADGTRQAVLHDRLAAIDGYSAPSRAGQLLHGLGFGTQDETRPVKHFSGGWRVRLNLARALMCRSDLLLLDEPTNHLDLDTVLWLEDWLRAYAGTLLLISHDREFLDRVVHQILHLDGTGVKLYPGNYSDFELLRAEHLAARQAGYRKQQRAVAHMRRFVERFRAKATKARQAQSRLKALARMELIAAAHVESGFEFSFPPPDRIANPLLELEDVAMGYGGQAVLSGIRMVLAPGERLGLLGLNGAGKSTLVKLLAGEVAPMSGRREMARDLCIGYFAQHQLEQLRPVDSPLGHLRGLDPGAPEQKLRDFLGGFGFVGDMALTPSGPFSGGEKARLVLALLVYRRPGLLLLDEPTNHLDLEMRHALSVALQGFEGALVVVSHDRHLLKSTTDQFWLVADGGARPFDGDLDDYRVWLDQHRSAPLAPGHRTAPDRGAGARKAQRRAQAEARRRLQPLRRERERLEDEMERLQARQASLEEALADPGLYAESMKDRLKERLLEKAGLDRSLSEIEDAWLDLTERLETEGVVDE